MPLPSVKFKYLEQIFSPFTGLPAELNDDGANGADPTLLFVYYGMVGEWEYVSPRFPTEVTRFIDNLEPGDVAESLEVEGGLMFAVDTDWNGINYYGFAPAESKIAFVGGVEFESSSAG